MAGQAPAAGHPPACEARWLHMGSLERLLGEVSSEPSISRVADDTAAHVPVDPLFGVAAFGIFLSSRPETAIVGTLVYTLAQEAIGGLVHAAWARHYLLSVRRLARLFHTPTDRTPIVRSIGSPPSFIIARLQRPSTYPDAKKSPPTSS